MAEPISNLVAIKAARSAWVDRAIFASMALLIIGSAVATKRMAAGPALAALDRSALPVRGPVAEIPASATTPREPEPAVSSAVPLTAASSVFETPSAEIDSSIRYYDGRPVRPVKNMWMQVTAYSPDARSCGKFADGRTASMKSVWTNGGCLVAADTTVLPMGSLVSIPGYAGGMVVPVLDRGGKIKGPKLDVLYPTHEVALSWGVQRLPVTIWEFADEDE